SNPSPAPCPSCTATGPRTNPSQPPPEGGGVLQWPTSITPYSIRPSPARGGGQVGATPLGPLRDLPTTTMSSRRRLASAQCRNHTVGLTQTRSIPPPQAGEVRRGLHPPAAELEGPTPAWTTARLTTTTMSSRRRPGSIPRSSNPRHTLHHLRPS